MDMMDETRLQIMNTSSYLLPDPGGEVVRDLIAAYRVLQKRHAHLRKALEIEQWECNCRADERYESIDAVLEEDSNAR